MSERPHAVDANQARASEPDASAWVSANAGTGKTEVLVRRSLRLLLSGSPPERILCLTYTKAAAAEMENRLLTELAAWATMSMPDLDQRLQELVGLKPDEEDIKTARRLFARTLEARGGLKIFTIHGFCERLLQRFPLEAGITPHFTVLDERGALLLRRAAFDAAVGRAASDRDGPLGAALAKIIARTGEAYFRTVIDAVLAKRNMLSRMVGLHEHVTGSAETECEAVKHLFGVEQECEDALIEALAGLLPNDVIDGLLAVLEKSGGTNLDERLKAALSAARETTGEARIAALRPIFFTEANERRKQICSAATRQAAPALCQKLSEASDKFIELDCKLVYLRAAESSAALLLLADTIQADYERRKRAEAALDYDDLVLKSRNLLAMSGAASWVLFKIDGGIDHILVDEAQDTNQEQWSIIASLAEEFFAGEGRIQNLRTLFAVGDEKQSIYSFQGADPARFGRAGTAFRRMAEAAGLSWHDVPLTLSFRSTVPVLQAVDAVFARPEAAQGLTWQEGAVIQHDAHRKGEAGLVEIWDLEEETGAGTAPAFEPWNDEGEGEAAVDRLCNRIASTIDGWLKGGPGGELLSRGRRMRAGDILILVRRRAPFTAPMIRALKRLGIPVAGADRMRLTDQIAVQDLLSLADFLLMQEDDLSLAVVLKSPLFGLNDDDLFSIGYQRPHSLWSALREKAETEPRFAEAVERLTSWLARADLMPPYEFYAHVLGENSQLMRKRMLTRLGPEAAEAIDALLDLALAYDRDAAPSLQGFVELIRAGEVDIKRDMEQDRDEVRVMTVHGAKGLQAPIVFLPDTCQPPQQPNPRLYSLPREGEAPEEVGHLLWPSRGIAHQVITDAKNALQRAETDEYHRLLYVAMTRARDRLYVCGWLGKRALNKTCWYALIDAGLKGHLIEIEAANGSTVRRMENTQDVSVKAETPAAEKGGTTPLPEWARTQGRQERPRLILQPSRLAAHLAGETGQPSAEQGPLGPIALAENTRFLRGRLVHALLQHLPQVAPAERERVARIFVTVRGPELPAAIKEEVIAESLAIVRDPRFGDLFGKESLAEVPIVARFGDGESAFDLSGQIDRLAVLDGQLLILDYKTNRPPPSHEEEVAPAYIAQLAAYRLALRRMFAKKPLKAVLLWTDGPRLMEIPSTLLDAAERELLQRGARLDVG